MGRGLGWQKGGVASHKHPRCWPPVHWLQSWFCVLSARHPPYNLVLSVYCHPGHPGHPLVHLVWTVLLHCIHKGTTRPSGQHFCRLVSVARPVSSPIPRPSVSVTLLFTPPLTTACIFNSTYCLTTTDASDSPAFCYKVPKSPTTAPADLQSAGAHFCVQL